MTVGLPPRVGGSGERPPLTLKNFGGGLSRDVVSHSTFDCELHKSVAFASGTFGKMCLQLILGFLSRLLGLAEFTLGFFGIVRRDLRSRLRCGGVGLSLLGLLAGALRQLSSPLSFLIGNLRRTARHVGVCH